MSDLRKLWHSPIFFQIRTEFMRPRPVVESCAVSLLVSKQKFFTNNCIFHYFEEILTLKNKLQITPHNYADIILFDYISNIIVNLHIKPIIIHPMIYYYLLPGVLVVYLHMQVYKVSVQTNILTYSVLCPHAENFPLTLSSHCSHRSPLTEVVASRK